MMLAMSRQAMRITLFEFPPTSNVSTSDEDLETVLALASQPTTQETELTPEEQASIERVRRALELARKHVRRPGQGPDMPGL